MDKVLDGSQHPSMLVRVIIDVYHHRLDLRLTRRMPDLLEQHLAVHEFVDIHDSHCHLRGYIVIVRQEEDLLIVDRLIPCLLPGQAISYALHQAQRALICSEVEQSRVHVEVFSALHSNRA